MDLSIIIVNWRSADYLWACLRSLYLQTRGISFEVIVVDNDSHDGCETMIRKEFPAVKLITARENLGFARANNLGYSYSSGQILLFLNPDTEILGNSLSRMVDHLRTQWSAGAVGARLLNSDGSLQTSCVQAFPSILNQLLDFDALRRLFPAWKLWGMQALLAGQPPDTDAISGACFMLKRCAFEEAGRFSEEYFMYADDLDLSYKVRRAGYAIHCLNECEVIHHGGKSSAQQADYFSDVLQRESLARFFRKTRGGLYAAAYRFSVSVIALIRLVLIACVAPLGGIGLDGKAPRSVLGKWLRILKWAAGLEQWPRTAGSHAGA